MFAEDHVSGIMRVIRAVGVLAVFMIALAGAPQSGTAFECDDYLISCSTADACVAALENPCGCEGAVHCDAGWGCEGSHNVATICREEQET